MQQSETSRPEGKVWQPFHAGAAFARFCREMIPDPHCRSSSGAVAVLLALLSSTAAAGSVEHANQNAEELRRIGCARAASTPALVTMQAFAYFHTTPDACWLQTTCLDAFSTPIVRAGLHRRRLRGTCVVSCSMRFGMNPGPVHFSNRARNKRRESRVSGGGGTVCLPA